MALQTSPEASRGILGAIKGVMGLFSDVNKDGDMGEGSNPTPTNEYESTLDDNDILKIVSQRKRDYSVYYTPIEQSQKLAFGYWLGAQRSEEFDVSDTLGNRKDLVDNLIFEAVETFLPIATRANPDPLVTADPSDIGQRIAHDIKCALVDWADTEKLRRKLARTTRNWTWGRIGVIKVYWDPITKTIKIENVNPKRMIFDKDGYVDEGGIFVGPLLENRVVSYETVSLSSNDLSDVCTRRHRVNDVESFVLSHPKRLNVHQGRETNLSSFKNSLMWS